MTTYWPPDTLDRMVRAVEKVRERTLRTAAALEAGGIPYAVVGGNAVAVWVARVDAGAVRNTRDVDVLVDRADLDRVIAAMATAGFEYNFVNGVHLFIDGPTGKPSEGVHLLFAGEPVTPHDPLPAPGLNETERGPDYQVVSLEPLVRMKLVSYRLKDQMHLVDLAQQRLIDDGWPARYPSSLADRLREILARPESRPQFG